MFVFIPGAWSDSSSFNHFKQDTHFYPCLHIDYDVNKDLSDEIQRIREKIEYLCPLEVNLIGHSLGGVISLALVNSGLEVKSLTTLSAPFGGIVKFWLQGDLSSKLFHIIHTYNIKQKVDIKHKFFVSTHGINIFLPKKNDGVVTIESQMAVPYANYELVKLNHFSILKDKDVIDKIKNFTKV